MMRISIWFVLVAVAFTVHCGGANQPATTGPGGTETERLIAYLDAEYEKELAFSPETLTFQGRKEQYDRLDDRSEEAEDRVFAWRRQSVAGMKSMFDYGRLDDDGKTWFDMWALELEHEERRRAFRRHPYLFARLGDHVYLPEFLITFHRVDERPDLDAYLARTRLIDDALDQTLVKARRAAADGIRAPAFAYTQALDEIRRVTTGAPFTAGADSSLFADAKRKAAVLRDAGRIGAAEADAFTAAVSKALVDEVEPGYDRVAAWLESERQHARPEPAGVWSLPNGAAYYDSALVLQTTTTLKADEIHDMGLAEVSRLRGEMEALKARVGFRGTLAGFFTFMRTDRQFFFANTDEGRAAYIALAERYLGDMQKTLPDFFGILPRAALVVRRVEPFREEPGGAQHYFESTPDGSRPGIFYAHLADMNAMPRYQLECIAYHEGVPGHHLQISIAQERTAVPEFRRQYSYGAFTEGWSLYAETLAKEMGFYTDPYSDFGRLSGEVWRAIRLVVDTGIHAQQWTEGQSVQYFLDNSPLAEGAIRSEVRRYFVWPGQATTYTIGMLTIQQLRDEARATLGATFDIRAFHDVLLSGGSVPLPVLQSRVRRWVAQAHQNSLVR